MPGQPKRRRLIKEIERRARQELGENASVLDYFCAYPAAGGRFESLARDLSATIGE